MILFYLFSLLTVSSAKLDEARLLFTKIESDEGKNEALLKLTSNYTLDFDPTIYAYNAAAEMTMANHTIWPTSKLSYFKSGKRKLEDAVKKYPDNIEIRYIRYAVQKGSPDFLGYRNNMNEDRTKIENNIDRLDWSDGFKKIVKTVISTK